ncbi:hypothetical protein N0V83_005128 [Neocucurbitaria cava]|uniref:Uncharacterized protein n=1 Tax=Neocucurbitaria cava TaxID=798079 RepID=A0A9W8Y969_9PLEO|nr:hypothetical protein N0V83_005128 [Neocucurbitaria cava]
MVLRRTALDLLRDNPDDLGLSQHETLPGKREQMESEKNTAENDGKDAMSSPQDEVHATNGGKEESGRCV